MAVQLSYRYMLGCHPVLRCGVQGRKGIISFAKHSEVKKPSQTVAAAAHQLVGVMGERGMAFEGAHPSHPRHPH